MSKMNCVSYSRALAEKAEVPPIPEQQQMIADFLKTRKLTVSKRYTDRKLDPQEEENFYALKSDGISRKYDCVAFASMDYFGRSVLCGYDLLYKLFLPAGIHFICISDAFCSFEHSREEIEEYLKDKKRAYHAKACGRKVEANKEKRAGREKKEDAAHPQSKHRAHYDDILSMTVYEKETGDRCITKPNVRYPAPVYSFFDPDNSEKQKSVFVTVEEMLEKVIKRIEAEKELALRLRSFVASPEGVAFQKQVLAGYHAQAKELLDRLLKKISKMPVSEDGDEADPKLAKQIERLDAQYRKLFEEYEKKKREYTRANRWIALYASFDRSSFTSRKAVSQYLEKIVCDRYGNTEFYLKEQESRAVFPDELFITEELKDAEEEQKDAAV